MLLVLVIVGLICALLLLFITLQHISITAERDLLKTYKDTVEELNHTISSLQHNITDLTTDKHQLEDKYNSLSQEKLELETRVTSLSDELMKAYSKQGWLSTEAMSWSDSRQYCMDQGANLVIINNEAKQRFISSLVNERVWIGLNDIEIEGSMKWVDNSPLNQGYWFSGEPNNLNGNEDCIELLPTRPVLNNWNDMPCSQLSRGICEK